MTAFPATPFAEDFDLRNARAYAPHPARWRAARGAVDHVFTHFSLELSVFSAHLEPPAPQVENCRWALAHGLDKEGLPTLMRKVAVHAGLMRD
jgi:A/G-specific adenine glycosylase